MEMHALSHRICEMILFNIQDFVKTMLSKAQTIYIIKKLQENKVKNSTNMSKSLSSNKCFA